ncbi:MAG: tRNA (N6-threonylcarbamoyladenosine(37)-N6)-methyltransferase TrmO, partial [Candidatus Bathyarchaeia archaeon]
MTDSIEKGRLAIIGTVEAADGDVSRIRIHPPYCPGLEGLDSFSHTIILYWLHLRDNDKNRRVLRVLPRRHPGAPEVGVFASRSPSRPNPLAICVTELLKVEGCTLLVKGLDAVEGSPVVDIKPYIPRADSVPTARVPEWTSHGPPT